MKPLPKGVAPFQPVNPSGCYYAPDGTFMNADGTRNIFDDVDEDGTEDYNNEPPECSYCAGTGEGTHDGSACSHCHGTGVEPAPRSPTDTFYIDPPINY